MKNYESLPPSEIASFHNPAREHDELIMKVNGAYEYNEKPKLDNFQNSLEEIKKLEEYQEYQKFPIQFETFTQIVSEIEKRLNTHTGKEKEKALRSIKKFASDIENSITDYFNIVSQTEHFEVTQITRMNPDDFHDERERKHKLRSQIHDGLLSTLKAFSRYCYKVLPEKFEEIEIPKEKLFTSEQLSNRQYIGKWAYDVELGRRIEEIVNRLEKRKEGSQA